MAKTAKPHREDPETRDRQVREYCRLGIKRAEMCRLSDRPETALLIGRSVFPLLVQRLYEEHCDDRPEKSYKASMSHMLESLKVEGVITEAQLLKLREGALGLTEYGSSRNVTPLVNALGVLQELASTVSIMNTVESGVQIPGPEISGPSRLHRLAHAAAILATLGWVR